MGSDVLGLILVAYLVIGTLIMYVYLNDKVTYRLGSIMALLVCIVMWLPIVIRASVKKHRGK
jgi:hypothetical protein